MALLSLGSGYGTCWLLARRYFPRQAVVASLGLSLVLFLAFVSRFALLMGQPTLIAMLFLTVALVSTSDWVGGVALAFMTLIKMFFIFTLTACLRRRRQVVGVFVLALVGMIAISFLVFKLSWYDYYLKERFVGLVFHEKWIDGLDYYNQSLSSTLLRLDLGEFFVPFWLLIALGGGWWVWRRGSLLLGVLFSLFLSPVVWQHYLVVLFPLFVYLSATVRTFVVRGITLAAFLLWVPEFGFLHTAAASFWPGLLASHYFSNLVLLAGAVGLQEGSG